MCDAGATPCRRAAPAAELCSGHPFLHFPAGSGAVRVSPRWIAHVSAASDSPAVPGLWGHTCSVCRDCPLCESPAQRQESLGICVCSTKAGKMDMGTEQQFQGPCYGPKPAQKPSAVFGLGDVAQAR